MGQVNECRHKWDFVKAEIVQPSEDVPKCLMVHTACKRCNKEQQHPSWIEAWETDIPDDAATCPDCGTVLIYPMGGGEQCPDPECGYWFCY